MIPARIGSVRLKYKNLALIHNKAVIEYAIINALNSNIFTNISINSDSNVFEYFTKKYNIEFFKRKKKLASSSARSDDVIYNYITDNNLTKGTLVWLNPIAPLIDKYIIKDVIDKFIDLRLSSAVTSNVRQVHAIFNRNEINYNKNEKFSKTQDLIPISTFNYAIMMWDIKKFKKYYLKNNYCFFINKFKNIDIPEQNSFIIKNKYDLKIVEKFMKSDQKKITEVKYHYQISKIK